MLVEFSVGNFRSFKDIQTLSMVAAPISSKNKELDEQNTFQATPKLRLLKTKAIYGANGSGKSNLIKALNAFKANITSIFEGRHLPLSDTPFFFSTQTENQPSFFQIIFIVEQTVFRYGFEVLNKEIITEWLFGTPNKREVYFFKRTNQEIDINEKHLKGAKKIQSLIGKESLIFKNTTLFLTVLGSLNIPTSVSLIRYFNNLTIDILDSEINPVFENLKRKLSILHFIGDLSRDKTVELLKYADSTIKTMGVVEVPTEETNKTEKVIVFTGDKFNDERKKINQRNVPFFGFASEGTLRIFDIAPYIKISLENGQPLIMDEFDSKLHPIITKKIVELYNKNTTNAQLIFVTHDTNLLDNNLLRRDQITFVEKDKEGASQLYTLLEFKGVRNDASFEKDYLDGRYGAIPFVGNFEYVFSK